MKELYVLGTSPLDCIRIDENESFDMIRKVVYRCDEPTLFKNYSLAMKALTLIQNNPKAIVFESENKIEQDLARNYNYRFDVSKLEIFVLAPLSMKNLVSEPVCVDNNPNKVVMLNNTNGVVDIPIRAKLSDYTWSELSILSKSHVDFDKYNIKVGDDKDGKILVDISDKGHYDGLVFMYNTDTTAVMNPYTKEERCGYNRGGYAVSRMSDFIENLYDKLEEKELKAVIKEVTIKCNDGYNNFKAMHDLKCHMFIPSVREVGFSTADHWYKNTKSFLNKEGVAFTYFIGTTAKSHRINLCSDDSWWWLRSACGSSTSSFWCVRDDGILNDGNSCYKKSVVAAFVL